MNVQRKLISFLTLGLLATLPVVGASAQCPKNARCVEIARVPSGPGGPAATPADLEVSKKDDGAFSFNLDPSQGMPQVEVEFQCQNPAQNDCRSPIKDPTGKVITKLTVHAGNLRWATLRDDEECTECLAAHRDDAEACARNMKCKYPYKLVVGGEVMDPAIIVTP